MLEIINALQAWSHDIMKEYSSRYAVHALHHFQFFISAHAATYYVYSPTSLSCSIVESSEKISLGLFKQEDFTTLSKAQQSLSFHSNKVCIECC